MEYLRLAIAALALLTLGQAIGAAPNQIISQDYSTMTIQTTTTSSYTYAATSAVTTQYVTETLTEGLYGPTSFSLNICGQGARLQENFQATKGDKYRFQWKSPSPLDFYITTVFSTVNNVGCSEGY